jgi:hypothetical protein
MFFESIESRLSSVVRIESFGKCFIIPSAREARFVPHVELFKACNKKCFFVRVSCCPKIGSWERTDKNTNSESDIIHIKRA